MRSIAVSLCIGLSILAVSTRALAADAKDKIKVVVESVGLHPGMDPGMYVCASGHLHIKGTVENQSGVTVGPVRVAGKAFGPDGRLMGEAMASTKQPSLAPGATTPIDLEFLTVGGPLIRQVKRHEITVIEAPTK